MTKKISAVICTYNRDKYIGKSIESLVNQTLLDNQYEIIIVDNKSTDNTREVVCDGFKDVNHLSYYYEPVQGLSQARNTGTKNAKGTYIAFLDDDAIACNDWLERIVDAFENYEAQLGSVGGKISPIWEVERPSWLSDEIVPVLTVLDWFDKPTILSEKYWLAGANIAFPKFLLDQMGGFDTSLGRKGSNLLSNEETVMRQDIEKAGYQCLYDPKIYVDHHVPSERVNQKWFKRRFYWQGVSKAVLASQAPGFSRSDQFRALAKEIKSMISSPSLIVRLLFPSNNPSHFTRKCIAMRKLGYIIGLLGVHS